MRTPDGGLRRDRNFSGLSGRARKKSFTLPDVYIFDMAAGRSCGGSFDEITGHCYFTVKRAVFINNNPRT